MPTPFDRRSFLASTLLARSSAAQLPASSATPPPRVTLGKTGLRVTRLGFGGTAASDPSVVARAIDAGINFIDSARVYLNGNHERMIGSVIKGRRHQLVIQTKTTASTREAALRDLETSLRELGTDYVDIWYLHGRNLPSEVPDELFEAQQVAKQQGKTRFVGVSMHFTMKEMVPYLIRRGLTDVIFTAYNFSMPPDMEMEKVLAEAHQAGLGIVTMKAMAGGYARIDRGDRLYTDNPKALKERLKRPGAMLAALKWVLRNPHVHSVVVGMADDEQIEQNISAISEPFTPEDNRLLARYLKQIAPLYCRMCGACTGQCSKGLPVADVLRWLTYAQGYGQFDRARRHFLELPPALRSVRCLECPQCTVRCPRGVRVRERLALAQEWFA